jgi:hypothetical protein
MIMSECQESYQEGKTEGRKEIIAHFEMAIAQLKKYSEKKNPQYKRGIEYSVGLLEEIVNHSLEG